MTRDRRPTRRAFLRWGAGGVGVILVGGGVGVWRLRGSAPRVAGLRCLSDHEYRTMKALAATIIPAGGPFPPGADDFDVARRFDEFLADESPENVSDVKGALLLVEYGPVIFDRRWRTFSNLDAAAQRRHWDDWELSPSLTRRKAALAFRKFVNLVFYDQMAVWPFIGYPRTPVVAPG